MCCVVFYPIISLSHYVSTLQLRLTFKIQRRSTAEARHGGAERETHTQKEEMENKGSRAQVNNNDGWDSFVMTTVIVIASFFL